MEEESDQEVFEDAPGIETDGTIDLDTALADAKLAVNLFFNNKFNEAKFILEPWVGKSMYHTIGHAVFSFMEALLTFEKQAIAKASEELKHCVALCDFYRKKNTLTESIGKMYKKPKYVELTPEEMHAELCYAESLLLKAMLALIEDETLVNFIKAGLKIRTSYNSYKECNNMLKARDWSGVKHIVDFESGVHVGIGSFNLMISLLPGRVIKLLEFIGFSGNKELGLSELLAAYRLQDGVRRILSIMGLLTYNLIIVYALSHEEGDLELCSGILKQQLQLYPDGAWFLYFKGRLEFMKCNIPEAIRWYKSSWSSQSAWIHFHHLCFWELLWTHSILQDWDTANQYASHLLRENKWSRTIFGYLKVCQLLMKTSLTKSEQEEIEDLIVKIPLWKQRIAGKSLPMEKFCVKRCKRFSNQNNSLVLPAVEFLYLMNLFKVIGKKWDVCQSFYKLVLKAYADCERGSFQGSEFEYDNLCLLLLLKGACLAQMKSPLQAEDCLKTVLQHEKKLKEDLFLVPFAMVELALVYNNEGRTQQAIQTLEDVKKNYSGYSLESRLHFRIHLALLDFNNKK